MTESKKQVVRQCTISFVGKSTPSEMYEQLKKAIVQATEFIDEETPWQNTEPKWWLEMMDLQRRVR